MGSPTGHFNHCAFLSSLGSMTEKLPLQMTRHSRILLIVGYFFLHMSGVRKYMYRAFLKDSTSTWHNQDSNPGPPDPEASRPQRHISLRIDSQRGSHSSQFTGNSWRVPAAHMVNIEYKLGSQIGYPLPPLGARAG